MPSPTRHSPDQPQLRISAPIDNIAIVENIDAPRIRTERLLAGRQQPHPLVQITTKGRRNRRIYVHGDSWRSSDRCDQLRQLFGLSPSEARLALALSRGASIAESAEKFGLAIDTVRKYTKSTYAKLGARGLPDLVRIVMRSVVIFAPER